MACGQGIRDKDSRQWHNTSRRNTYESIVAAAVRQSVNTCGPGARRLAKDGTMGVSEHSSDTQRRYLHLARIATKSTNILLDPLECESLIMNTYIRRAFVSYFLAV